MKKVKFFYEFLNESEEISSSFKKAVDVVIHFTLQQLLPNGGNSDSIGIDWKEVDPVFSKSSKFETPDLFINFTAYDAKSISKELEIVWKAIRHWRGYKHRNSTVAEERYIEEQFKENGLVIEFFDIEFVVGEIIIALDCKKFEGENNFVNLVTDFYRKREARIKEIEKRWKTHFTSKRYGL
jgi:hypothetical protein